MAITSLEDRVSALETELQRLRQLVETDRAQPGVPWFEKIYGVYQHDPEFEEAMRLGREYREAQRPPAGAGE